MELVQGVPITEFCDKNRLPAEERIKLFIQVCQAIQSAHQKGIIHRDLKPTNILVTLNAGMPVPMVIDFGVAKATQQKLTEKTVFTNYATMIGTPAYMSPEQAEMSRLDVDTRSDIYGLGVLLYELLTGTTPFPEKRLRSASYQEMQRIILEEEPERPSTRLSTLTGEQRSIVDRNRGDTELTEGNKGNEGKRFGILARNRRASQAVAGDLDWIVMKCLEKDRTRRYETANCLAADLKRHLENEPVVARPPSQLYRLQKLVRRNKLAFAAGAMVALALLVGMALAAWQAVRASRERDAKEAALRQAVAAQQEQTRLREEAQTAERDEARLREQAQAEAYASDMLLAQQSISANNFGRARELLYRHRPQSKSDKDLRGWEWRYLWQQCTNDALAKIWQATNMVTDLAVSRDGKWLAVGQNSHLTAVNILKFLDRTTVRLVTNIPPRRGTDVNVAFSPTAPLLAYCSSRYTATNVEATLHLWNVETRQSLVELPLRSFCGGVAFSPDGSSLLVLVMNHQGSSDGELLLLRVPELTPLWEYETSVSNPCRFMSIDPAFRLAAVGGDRLQVIDLLTGKLRWSRPTEHGDFLTHAFTRDGTNLMTAEGSPSVLRVWDANSGKPMAGPMPLQHGEVDILTLLPDGKSLASAGADGTLHFWDVSNPTEPRSLGRLLRGQVGQVNALALSADGKTLLSGSSDGAVYAWDAKPAQPDQSPVHLTGVFDWEFASDGQSLLTIDTRGGVTRREGPDFQVTRPLLDLGGALSRGREQTEFSDDGGLLVTERDGAVRIWALSRQTAAPPRAVRGWLGAHSFAPASKLVILYDQLSDSVQEWNLDTFQMVRSWPKVLPWRQPGLLLALSSRGKYLLNVSVNGDEAWLREVATGQICSLTNLGSGRFMDANFSPDGALFALASSDGLAQIWESDSRRPVTTVGHHQLPIWGLSFSPDGSRLLTASDGPEALTLWDLRSGRELVRLPAAGYRFESPQFSADGSLVGCRNWQNELYLWRAPSWEEIEAAEKTVPDSQSTNMQKGNL